MSYESGGLLRACDMTRQGQGIVQINCHEDGSNNNINLTWPTRASTEPIGAVQMTAAPAAMMRWSFIISDWIWLTLLSRLEKLQTLLCVCFMLILWQRLLL